MIYSRARSQAIFRCVVPEEYDFKSPSTPMVDIPLRVGLYMDARFRNYQFIGSPSLPGPGPGVRIIVHLGEIMIKAGEKALRGTFSELRMVRQMDSDLRPREIEEVVVPEIVEGELQGVGIPRWNCRVTTKWTVTSVDGRSST